MPRVCCYIHVPYIPCCMYFKTETGPGDGWKYLSHTQYHAYHQSTRKLNGGMPSHLVAMEFPEMKTLLNKMVAELDQSLRMPRTRTGVVTGIAPPTWYTFAQPQKTPGPIDFGHPQVTQRFWRTRPGTAVLLDYRYAGCISNTSLNAMNEAHAFSLRLADGPTRFSPCPTHLRDRNP